jgi:carboxylesterase
VAELEKFLGVVEEALPQISAPALIMHSRHDKSIPPENLEAIFDGIGSTAKEKFWVERGGHIMTEDVDKEKVYKRIGKFLDTNLHHSQ